MELFPSQIEDKQENQTIEQAVKFGALLGEGGSFSLSPKATVNARMWANEQSSEMNPRTLELLCREVCDKNNIEISVLQAPDLHREKLNLIEAVGQGSPVPPRLIVMTYM